MLKSRDKSRVTESSGPIVMAEYTAVLLPISGTIFLEILLIPLTTEYVKYTLNHYVAIIYRPPGSTKFKEFKEALDWLDSKLGSLSNPTPTISVCGDFNFNKSVVTWSLDSDGDLVHTVANHREGGGEDGIKNAKQAQALFDFTSKHYLVQHVDKTTRSVNEEVLDLFFTNDHTLVSNVLTEQHSHCSDHNLISIGVSWVLEKKVQPTTSTDPENMTHSQRYNALNFNKAPWSVINLSLAAVDWSPMKNMGPEDALDWMNAKILEIVEECVQPRMLHGQNIVFQQNVANFGHATQNCPNAY